MASRIMEISAGLFAARIVVTRSGEVRRLSDEMNVPCLLHELPNRNDTVRLGLEWLMQQAKFDGCVFAPADQPLLGRMSLRLLLTAAESLPERIWRLSWQGEPGTPVYFPAKFFPELLTLPEGKGGGVLCKRYPELVSLVEVDQPWELRDVDTKEDLRELLNIKRTAL